MIEQDFSHATQIDLTQYIPPTSVDTDLATMGDKVFLLHAGSESVLALDLKRNLVSTYVKSMANARMQTLDGDLIFYGGDKIAVWNFKRNVQTVISMPFNGSVIDSNEVDERSRRGGWRNCARAVDPKWRQ